MILAPAALPLEVRPLIKLGIKLAFPYGGRVIGFLRMVGLVNAAVWFGAAVFYLFGAGPLTHSTAMQGLLGPRNFPYFSQAIEQLLTARYFHLHIICGLIALAHLTAEWLYLGKYPRRFWLGLTLGLAVWGLVNDYSVQPRLKTFNERQHTAAKSELRDAARRSFIIWNTVTQSFNYLMAVGLAVYFWRQANPPDPARFVPTAKFRG